MNNTKNIINAYFNILLKSDLNLMVILSPAGYGKTTAVVNSLKEKNLEEGIHYLYYNSFFTPLAFYQTLDEVNQLSRPNILILDDVETLLHNREIINLLKSATWGVGGRRQVSYVSSKKSGPKSINFKGNIVVLINETPEANPMFKAIVDRSLFCELKYSQEELMNMIKQQIVDKPYKGIPYDKRIKVFDYVRQNVNGLEEISFRTLIKAFDAYLHAPQCWQELIKHQLK